jgi:hypothetical protein
MATGDFYRGGISLQPLPHEVKRDPRTGLLQPTHGLSVFDQPDHLEKFGGAHQVTNVPAELRIIQRGRNSHHFEIVPAQPMTMAEYEEALQQIVLVPV